MEKQDLHCAICGHPFVSVWLHDRSAGLCGTCADKAPGTLLRLIATVSTIDENWNILRERSRVVGPRSQTYAFYKAIEQALASFRQMKVQK